MPYAWSFQLGVDPRSVKKRDMGLPAEDVSGFRARNQGAVGICQPDGPRGWGKLGGWKDRCGVTAAWAAPQLGEELLGDPAQRTLQSALCQRWGATLPVTAQCRTAWEPVTPCRELPRGWPVGGSHLRCSPVLIVSRREVHCNGAAVTSADWRSLVQNLEFARALRWFCSVESLHVDV